MSESLAGWLSARIDEDERAARIALACGVDGQYDAERWFVANAEVLGADGTKTGIPVARARHADPGVLDHIAAWDPARVLAEVAAKRRIIERWSKLQARIEGEPDPGKRERLALTRHGLDFALHVLALPYAGRDGYRDEWRPE